MGASVSKQSEAAVNYMLESVRKLVGTVIRAPQHIINLLYFLATSVNCFTLNSYKNGPELHRRVHMQTL